MTVLERYPIDWEHLVLQMIEATQEAIADASLHKTHHTATQGQPEKAEAGGSRYSFLLIDDWEPGANTRVRIEMDPNDPDQTIAGTILSTTNTRIILATEVPLPNRALQEGITLYEDTVWLRERLRDSLLRIQQQGENVRHLGAVTFGLSPCIEGQGEPQAHIATFTPDVDQTKAIALGMESERLLLIGPPGTGKTATESALAIEYLLAGKTVLIAAHTNVALDTVMKRLKHHCEQSGNTTFVKEHQIVRVGVSTDLVGEPYQDIVLQNIVNQQLGQLGQERDRLQQEQRNLEETIAHHSHDFVIQKEQWERKRMKLQGRCDEKRQERKVLEARERERLSAIAVRLAAIEKERQSKLLQQKTEEQKAKSVQEVLNSSLAAREEWEQTLFVIKNRLATFRARSPLGRFATRLLGTTEQSLSDEEQQCMSELNRAKLIVISQEQQVAAASLQAFQLATQLSALKREEQQLRQNQQHTTEDAKNKEELTASIQKDEDTLQQGEQTITMMEKHLKNFQQAYTLNAIRLEDIEQKQQMVTSQVMAEARLIGTTLAGVTTNPYLRNRMFDAVMIDEASMASLAIVLVTAAHATKHVALFGDPTQLAPVVQLTDPKQTPLAAYWLGTDLFSYLRIRLEDADKGANQVVLLSQQSRMVPAIAAPDSQLIYGGRLKNRPDPHRIPLQIAPHSEWPLLLVDTSDVDRGKEQRVCSTQRPPRSSSKYNLYHVECVIQLVRTLSTQFPKEGGPYIGVITPYGAQKAKIRQALQKQGLLHQVHVGTVHSFQSVEYPCIIFDTTEGYGVPIGQFTSSIWGRYGVPHNATRLLNVAHSRAQDKLIYIANVDAIKYDSHRKEHLLTKFIQYVDEQGHIDSTVLFDA